MVTAALGAETASLKRALTDESAAHEQSKAALKKQRREAERLRINTQEHVKEKKAARKQAKQLSARLAKADEKLRVLDKPTAKFMYKLLKVRDS